MVPRLNHGFSFRRFTAIGLRLNAGSNILITASTCRMSKLPVSPATADVTMRLGEVGDRVALVESAESKGAKRGPYREREIPPNAPFNGSRGPQIARNSPESC
jgi:hypothetical protein